MVLEELTPSELAARVKIPERKVRKHLAPATFGSVTVDELRRYCEVFSVPLSSMLHALVIKGKNVSIREAKTNNPYFTMMKIEAGKK